MSKSTSLSEYRNFIVVAISALLIVFTLGLASCSDNSSNVIDGGNEGPGPTPVDITITIDNVGSSAWEVTDVNGDDNAATLNENNTTITLRENMRYRIINNGGSAHPFGLQDSNSDYLLAQDDRTGSFEDDPDVDFASSTDAVFFTLTPALAGELATYNCTIHVAMEGSVTVE